MATLEELESDVWDDSDLPTPLIRRCHELRKKDLADLTYGDFNHLITQGIGIEHLAPLVLALLEREPLLESDFYPGDVLVSLVVPRNWKRLEPWSQRVEAICDRALSLLPADPPDIEINGEFWPAPARTAAENLRSYLNRRSHKH